MDDTSDRSEHMRNTAIPQSQIFESGSSFGQQTAAALRFTIFASRKWYKPGTEQVELTDIEKAIVDLIRSTE
jgi:hypothetical protein